MVILKWVAIVGDRFYDGVKSLTMDRTSAQFNFTDEAKDNFGGQKILNIRVAKVQGNRFISVQYNNTLVESGYNLDEQEFENLYQMARNR